MYFFDLPYELKEHIFSFLSPEDLFCCLSVCREWRTIANSERLWLKTLFERGIDMTDFSAELIAGSDLCKYAFLWKLFSNTLKNWSSNSFVERLIPYDTSEDLTVCRILVYKERMALISNKITLYSFNQKAFTKEIISLPFVPHNVTMNNKYIVCTIGNIVLVYKKSLNFKKFCAIALTPSFSLIIQTEKLKKFLETTQKYGPYLKTEAIIDEYIWLSCLHEENRSLSVINLQNLTFSNKNIDGRLLVVTKHKVIVSTKKSIYIFNIKGDLYSSFTPEQEFNSFRATDHFIVTFVHYGYKMTILTMDGRPVWTMENPGPIKLDSKRQLLYKSSSSLEGNNCKLAAHSLETGKMIWHSEMHGVGTSEIEDMFLICDKFLVVSVYSDTACPVTHFGLIFDLEERKLLHKTPLSGYTMFISDKLWVQKRQNDLVIKTY